MKVFTDRKSDIDIFAKINGLNINNNQELQEYYDKVGFVEFMPKVIRVLLHSKRTEIEFNFCPDNQNELTKIKQFYLGL